MIKKEIVPTIALFDENGDIEFINQTKSKSFITLDERGSVIKESSFTEIYDNAKRVDITDIDFMRGEQLARNLKNCLEMLDSGKFNDPVYSGGKVGLYCSMNSDYTFNIYFDIKERKIKQEIIL